MDSKNTKGRKVNERRERDQNLIAQNREGGKRKRITPLVEEGDVKRCDQRKRYEIEKEGEEEMMESQKMVVTNWNRKRGKRHLCHGRKIQSLQ